MESLKASQIVPPEEQWLDEVATILLSGGFAAFPTETVYGLGGLATSTKAIAAIFSLKGRPSTNPLIVHLASEHQIGDVAALNTPLIRERVERLCPLIPGPLSLVLPALKDRSVPAVRADGETVAVRIPRHPVAHALLKRVGAPLAAPSANRSTRVSPTLASHVLDEFPTAGLFILDGGPCEIGLESTVIDLISPTPTILRPGSITQETLEATLGESVAAPFAQGSTVGTREIARSPGLTALHYSPKTPLYRLPEWKKLEQKTANIGLITFSRERASAILARETRALSPQGNLEEAAAQLYAVLRELDTCGLDAIVVGEIPGHGVGEAILDRLRRAEGR